MSVQFSLVTSLCTRLNAHALSTRPMKLMSTGLGLPSREVLTVARRKKGLESL